MSSSPLDHSLVVRRILSHFSAQEVLQLSTVNKLWNYEARCLLRDHRKCEAVIKKVNEVMPCARAKLLNDQIAKMEVIPFNALSVYITEHECPSEIVGKSIEDTYGSLINKQDLKQLRIDWSSDGGEAVYYCPLGQLLVRLMSAGSQKLEHLEVSCLPLEINAMPLEFVLRDENQPVRPVLGLPQLKRLKLPDKNFNAFMHGELILELITSTAPDLQVLENWITPTLLEFVPTQKFGIVRNVCFPPGMKLNEEMINTVERRFLQSNRPRLEEVKVFQPSSFHDEDEQRYWTLLWHLLHSNCDTLKEVDLDRCSLSFMAEAVGAVDFDRLRFPSVTQLYIYLPEHGPTGMDKYLFCLPMQEIFPEVTELCFTAGCYVRKVFFLPDDINDQIPWPAVIRATVRAPEVLRPLFRQIAAVLPSLECIEIPDMFLNNDGPPFHLFWRHWLGLKHLHIGSDRKWEVPDFDVNYDAEFCGIHPEEALVLQEMDEDYLRAVNLVCPFPAMNDLRGLRTVKIGVDAKEKNSEDGMEPDGCNDSFFLSKVTRFIAFRQMSHLKLQLITSSEVAKHLEHLKPWIEVKVEV